MTRAERRILKKSETEPVIALRDSISHYYPEFNNRLNATRDPRDVRYITYTPATMLGTGLLKNICGIESMQQMTERFNQEECIKNISNLFSNNNEELPHYVTLNEYLKNVDIAELRKVRKDIVTKLLRGRSFENGRYKKKWLVIVDATWLQVYGKEQDGNCLVQKHVTENGEEHCVWYRVVLEAKIVLGDGLIISLDTEFIENNSIDAVQQKEMSAEEIKQDCETKAFKRLARRLKKEYPRLPICLLGDSLYASNPVFELCRENDWDFIIRYKKGSIPTLQKEYESLPEREAGRDGKSEFANELDYKGKLINMLRYKESRNVDGKIVETTFQWLTSFTITSSNAEKMAQVGRKRWMIENEGFNVQKNLRYDLEHGNSKNSTALKNHYLLTQIADIFRQLYVYRYLRRLGQKRTEKNISSDLLASFARQLIREDIFNPKAGDNKVTC